MKFFVGYDLGDGETMIHLLKGIESSGSDPDGILLPGRKVPGPIPTIYSLKEGKLAAVGEDAISSRGLINKFCINFKYRPSTLIEKGRVDEFLSSSKDSEWPEDDCWNRITELKDSIVEFTNAIFLNQRVSSFITDGAEELHIFIGHPTTWNLFLMRQRILTS